VSFTVSGGSTLRYLVTDLAEGTWEVCRDGAIVFPALNVWGDEGTISLEGPAGAWWLRR
jgi:hypothetical protein